MRREDHYFDVWPKIVPGNRESTIEIAARFDHVSFRPDRSYEITYCPVDEFGDRAGWSAYDPIPLKPVDGRFRFSRCFEAEQEHVLFLEEVGGNYRKPVGDFRVYSLNEDLFSRRAYKGDFHMHTCRSDGWETPGYVAGACRRIGMDFFAVTDHRLYAPSIEAQRAFDGVEIDLRIFNGEEIHPPENPVHMINFGGRFSISELMQDEAAYRRAVAEVDHRIGPLPPGVDRYHYASCSWVFDRIREAGGLGIFCHPYWFTAHRYSPAGALTDHMFATQPFDAFEIIGGFHRHEVDSNTLQVARYHEERARGRQVPIVGASDAHGCERGEMFAWFYTIVFAPAPELPDVIRGVKDLYSVAVEGMEGESVRAYGPFRLVKYALFLLREFFPKHDALCAEEGRLMIEHAAGDPSAAAALAALKGRTTALSDRCWARRT